MYQYTIIWLQGSQEDWQAPVPRTLPEGEGERVQEQARVDGVYPQEEGRESPQQDAGGPGRGPAEQGQGVSQEEGGATGSQESWNAPGKNDNILWTEIVSNIERPKLVSILG